MKSTLYALNAGRTIDEFLAALSAGREVVALRKGHSGQYHLVRGDRWDGDRMTLGPFRQIEPLKSIFFQPREFLGHLGEDRTHTPIPDRIVIGVKNCDLAGLRIQDHLFRDLPPGDPDYIEAREQTLVVTCDCTDCLDVCFCPVVGERPYAESGYDINLSPLPNPDATDASEPLVDARYLIDAGSERGELRLNELSEYLQPASDDLIQQRDELRQSLTRRLVEQAAQHGLEPEMDLATAIRGSHDSELWNEFAQDCVECGACNFTCCTCHCFQLVDGLSDGAPARGKQWDGCLLMNFAHVAGGNPRAGRAKRLRNRFEKKFDYFPEVLDCYACDGCGRCTEVCTGNIDIRTVLARAAHETQSVHADRGDD